MLDLTRANNSTVINLRLSISYLPEALLPPNCVEGADLVTVFLRWLAAAVEGRPPAIGGLDVLFPFPSPRSIATSLEGMPRDCLTEVLEARFIFKV